MLVQIALYPSNSFSSSKRKDINLLFLSLSLNVLTYPLIFGTIKTNDIITLSNFIPVKYLELVFVLTNFEIIIVSTLTSQMCKGFLQHKVVVILQQQWFFSLLGTDLMSIITICKVDIFSIFSEPNNISYIQFHHKFL